MLEDFDPRQQFDERVAGLAMVGIIIFCAIVGGGIGVFVEQPVVGALIGGIFGIAVGIWLVPHLARERV